MSDPAGVRTGRSPSAPTVGPEGAESFYNEAPCGFLTTTPDGTIVNVNATFLEWTGYPHDEIVGTRRFAELLTPGGRLYHETHFAPLLRMHGVVKGIALDVVCFDGRLLPVFVHSVLKTGSDGRPRFIHMTLSDATARREYERELLHARRVAEESDRRVRMLHRLVAETAGGDRIAVAETLARVLSEVWNALGAAIWLLDTNQSALSLTSVTGVPLALDEALLPIDSPLPAAAAFRFGDPVTVASPEQAGREFPLLSAQMVESRLEALIAVPIVAGQMTLGAYTVYFARNRPFDADEVELHRTLGCQAGQAIERATLYEELRRVASHDALTGLSNRALFDDRLEQALARSERTWAPLAVLVIDLDGFKLVNDRLGHRAGDRVLVEAAHHLRDAVRPGDSVARIGGDEFAVLCEDVDADQTAHIVRRIQEAMSSPTPIDDETSVTGSIGAVVYQPDPAQAVPTPTELLHDADTAMYQAKADGKNRSRGGAGRC